MRPGEAEELSEWGKREDAALDARASRRTRQRRFRRPRPNSSSAVGVLAVIVVVLGLAAAWAVLTRDQRPPAPPTRTTAMPPPVSAPVPESARPASVPSPSPRPSVAPQRVAPTPPLRRESAPPSAQETEPQPTTSPETPETCDVQGPAAESANGNSEPSPNPVPKTPVKAIPSEEWEARVASIHKADVTTVERVRQLRALVESAAIQCRGKIRDIEPATSDGRETIALVVCPIWGGNDVGRFVVPPSEKDAIAKWQRWDRLAWRVQGSVDELGELSYRTIFERLADISRTPNPGPEPRPIAKQTGGPATYAQWIARFARAAYKNDARSASEHWDFGAKKTWLFPATLTESSNGRFRGKLDADGYCDAVVTTSMPGPAPDFGVVVVEHSEKSVRRWGFDPKATFEFVVSDQQLAALLSVGSKVEVTVDLDPDGAMQAMNGPFRAQLAVRRFKK